MQSSRNTGHVAAVALPRAVGRQPLRVGRAAVPDVPAVPHVRALHALGVDPGARVLRAPGGVPRALPPGGEGARLGRGQPPVGVQRGPHAHRHGARHHRARRHQEGHVFRLTRPVSPQSRTNSRPGPYQDRVPLLVKPAAVSSAARCGQ